MNVVIADPKTNEILYFVKDCVKHGNSFFGSNVKLGLSDLSKLSIKWTDDDLTANKDEKGEEVGYKEKAREIRESNATVEIKVMDQKALSVMTGKLIELSGQKSEIGDMARVLLHILSGKL